MQTLVDAKKQTPLRQTFKVQKRRKIVPDYNSPDRQGQQHVLLFWAFLCELIICAQYPGKCGFVAIFEGQIERLLKSDLTRGIFVMKNNLRSSRGFAGLLALLAAILAFNVPAQAMEGKVVARINGQPVYDWEIALAENEIEDELDQVGAKMRQGLLLRYVIDTRLMALAGVSAGLDNTRAFKRRVHYNRNQAMRDTYFEENVRGGIADKQLREIFDSEIKKFKPAPEVRARHILVKKEEEALDMVERLNRGEEFATLAREHSQGPSGRNGGDLGYFTKGQMDKNFEETAFSLERSEISAPVKSSFGWHIIKVEDKRMTKAPTYEELKDQIKGQLVQAKSRKLTADLRKAANVEVLDKALAAKFNAVE